MNPEGDILVLRRSRYDDSSPGRSDWPGGKAEVGESYAAAACRETAEETGILLSEDDLQMIYAFTSEPDERGIIISRFLYLCRLDHTPAVTLSDEHEAYAWEPVPSVVKAFASTSWKDALEFMLRYMPAQQ